MATQVILLERVESLGQMGDVVAVRPGYARNYLLPQKKALRASKENIAYFEAQKKVLAAENDKRRVAAEKTAKKLEGVKAPLIRQASEAGQLFGSVTSRDIAEQVSNASGEKVERSMVQMNQNFKSVGLFNVDIVLHPEVKISVVINIARSVEEAEIQAKTGKALIAEDSRKKQAAAEEPSEEEALAAVLEEDALEATREREAAESAEESEDAAELAAKSKARAERKKARKADEPEAGEAEENTEE
ncbi:MAG TPA: 50S ribosomal protein L9 [Alphaproteobacteria bacterium]|nr:50S ribosomal protein L9 [Micavibrio sp.]HQX26857.1 50S ribosomal protein L9 [Alphaproteobacteria bacterium]